MTNGHSDILKEIKPLTVQVSTGSASQAVSYTADVKSFRSDSRQSARYELVGDYKIAVRLTGGVVQSRMDYPASAFSDRMGRSFVNDGTEVVELTADGRIANRMAVPAEVVASLRSITPQLSQRMKGLFNRISSRQLVEQLGRLNFRSQPGKKATETIFQAPKETLQNLIGGFHPLSFSITIDDEIGAVTSTQSMFVVDKDETVTQTVNPVYTLLDGVPVLAGNLVDEVHTFATPFDMSANLLPPGDPSTVPEISEEELRTLQENGAIVREVGEPQVDPATRDYTIRTGELYESMQINAAPEELFRIPSKGDQ